MMERSMDPNLAIELRHDIAEVGDTFVCTVRRSPVDGEVNTGGRGQVRAVRLSLHWRTEGRGSTDSGTAHTVEVPVDEFGMAAEEVTLPVPAKGPISFDGHFIRVRWEIEARTDIKLAVDQRTSAEVLVIPAGGTGTYDRPHPPRTR